MHYYLSFSQFVFVLETFVVSVKVEGFRRAELCWILELNQEFLKEEHWSVLTLLLVEGLHALLQHRKQHLEKLVAAHI